MTPERLEEAADRLAANIAIASKIDLYDEVGMKISTELRAFAKATREQIQIQANLLIDESTTESQIDFLIDGRKGLRCPHAWAKAYAGSPNADHCMNCGIVRGDARSVPAACTHQSMKVISSSALLECRTCGHREIQERQ